MTFRVGMKVVCVNDTFVDENWKLVPIKPTKGRVYVIRGLQSEVNFSGILLEEIQNEWVRWQQTGVREMSFPVCRFRPIVSRKTDIAIFTAMLTPQGIDA